MTNGTAAGGLTPTVGGGVRAVRRACVALRADTRLAHAWARALRIVVALRPLAVSLARWIRWVAVPAVCALAQMVYERLAPLTRAGAARVRTTCVRAARAPELPVYAVAVVVAVVLGWIVGRGV